MIRYNFKKFFDGEFKKVRHNENYFSNGHFLLNKSILKNSEVKFLNQHTYDNTIDRLIEQWLKDQPEIITEFVPEKVLITTDKGTLISIYNNKPYGIDEAYYNLVKDCKIYIVGGQQAPFAVYKDNQWIGMVMPCKIRDLENTITITEYNAQIQEQEEQKEKSKQNQKKCLYLSNNKATVRNKEVTCVAEIVNNESYKNLYVEANYKNNYGEIFIDFGFICMGVGRTIDKNDGIEEIKYKTESMVKLMFNDFKIYITDCLQNMKFINVAEIKLMELAGEPEEYIQRLTEHREQVLELREKERQERELKRQEEEQEYVNQNNKIAKESVIAAEKAILNNERVINKDITIYKSRYDSNSLSIINHLMKLYGIEIPLKTQGWINKALANIYYNGNYWTYQYYTSSKASTVFDEYLNELVKKIKTKYNVA